MDSGLIRVTYTKSAIGYSRRQKDTVKALGLRRLGDSVIHDGSPAIRGMIDKVSQHLVTVASVGDVDVVTEPKAKGRKS